MKMRLSSAFRISHPLLDDRLCLLDELPVQVDRVRVYLAHGIVLAEDVLGSLLVVGVGLGGMFLALLAHAMRFRPVARVVRLAGLCGTMLVLALLFARQVA